MISPASLARKADAAGRHFIMKNLLMGVTLAVSLMGSVALAATVNPTSNVLGDTAATGSTLILRNTSGTIDAGSIDTNAISSSAVDTHKLLLQGGAIDTPKIACFDPHSNGLGFFNVAKGTCNASNVP